jgi:hypothetical protein
MQASLYLSVSFRLLVSISFYIHRCVPFHSLSLFLCMHSSISSLPAQAATNEAPACFLAEPLNGNAGGVETPPGYFPGVYTAVRAAGGLCIADEVQVGLGRLGTHEWGFEEHGVTPDIVTVRAAAIWHTSSRKRIFQGGIYRRCVVVSVLRFFLIWCLFLDSSRRGLYPSRSSG